MKQSIKLNNVVQNIINDDAENNQSQKLPYPKRVFLIISNEVCERFNFYGIKAILVLYVTNKLLLSKDDATILFHAFSMLAYFMCMFGAILSDVWLGKFKTIVSLSIIYTIGSVILSLGAIPTLNISAEISMYIGLLLIAIGRGGIKPCVSAFGGDQFKLPEQVAQMATYFSLFYFAINFGSFLSTLITPIFRADVHCFGDSDCYSFAFGFPAVLMIISIVIFLLGQPSYTIKPSSSGNMIVDVFRCITTAISIKSREKKLNPRRHWLDYAKEKCGSNMVNDTKKLLKILVLYLPLSLFSTLFNQQGSRWTFQATRMDGNIGFYDLKPDQMQIMNPLLDLALIPLFEVVFYPILTKVGISSPLQKLTWGGILAGVAFVVSGLVEFQLEKTYPILPGASEAQLRFFNGLPCDYNAVSPQVENFTLKALQVYEQKHIAVEGEKNVTYALDLITGSSNECPKTISGVIMLNETMASSVFVESDLKNAFIDDPDKSRTGEPRIRFLLTSKSSIEIKLENDIFAYKTKSNALELMDIHSGFYSLFINDKFVDNINFKQGGVYTVIGYENPIDGQIQIQKIEITAPNSINMLWLVPQYIILSLGEIMLCVTGNAFSYSEAPDTMKSVVQAFWNLTSALGDFIFIVVVGMRFFESQAYEFLLFAGLMFVAMIIFVILGRRYKSSGNTNSV